MYGNKQLWRTQEGRTATPLRDTAGGIKRCSPNAASKAGHRAGMLTSLTSPQIARVRLAAPATA